MREQQQQRQQPAGGGERDARRRRRTDAALRRRAALRGGASPGCRRSSRAGDEETRDRHRDEQQGLDFGDVDVAVLARGEDLGRHHPERAAEDVRRRERAERGEEGQDRRRRERRREPRQHDPDERAPASGAEGRRRFELRAVEARQGGAREEVEVDVHRVGVDEEDRPRPGQPPRGAARPQQTPDQTGRHAALAVEVEEGDDADQRRQRHRQREELAEHAPPRELGAREEEGERHADRPGEPDRSERDPEAATERRPLVRPVRELGERCAHGGSAAEPASPASGTNAAKVVTTSG